MVFIHGGGYTTGSSTEYPPHVLLNEDIVLVTVQYRLGILGEWVDARAGARRRAALEL